MKRAHVIAYARRKKRISVPPFYGVASNERLQPDGRRCDHEPPPRRKDVSYSGESRFE
jgi:hypothetical protein